MKKFKEMKKFTSAFLVTAMVVGMLPADVALAVSGSQVAADGTYTKTAHVARTDEDDENEDFWTEYDVKVSLEVKDGVFSNITVIPENGYQASESQTYFAKAYNKSKGFQTLLKDKEATEDTVNGWDAVSGATRTSDAIKTAALDAIREAEEKTAEPEKTEPVYVLMNIPYADFYKADVNNEEPVDAFSSATLNKTRTASLAGGSYHVKADGSEITGITFPVKVEGIDLSTYKEVTDSDSVEITVTNRGQTSTTTYSGKDALFENESYAYYVLSEVPAYYKEASANADGTLSFGSVVGEIQKLSGIETELMTETSYGDYQLDLSGLDMIDASADQVYAVIVSTSEGSDYGMRHLENIWRVSELAWCTGFTKDVHGCPTSSAHYVNMMGQHINKVTYYTSKGIYEIPVDNLYVPVKFEGSVKVENADVSAGSTAVTTDGIPADFEAEYTVDGLTEAAVNDGILTFSKDAEEGQYTMNVTDRSGKYAPISTAFILMTDEMPAEYNGDDEAPALKAAEGASDEAFNKYLKNITSVTVNGTSYAATGRGAVVIVKEDGSIDTGVQDGAVFGENGAYEITVSSTGYHDLTFTYTKEEAAEPENPTEPENPAEPENPTEPENPAEPENPTEPENPAEPENPTESENPAESGNPTESESPAESDSSADEESGAAIVPGDSSQSGTGSGTGIGAGIGTGIGAGIGTGAGIGSNTGTGSQSGTVQNTSQSGATVKTGDSNGMYLWMSLLLLSLCGGGCVLIFKRRKEV